MVLLFSLVEELQLFSLYQWLQLLHYLINSSFPLYELLVFYFKQPFQQLANLHSFLDSATPQELHVSNHGILNSILLKISLPYLQVKFLLKDLLKYQKEVLEVERAQQLNHFMKNYLYLKQLQKIQFEEEQDTQFFFYLKLMDIL